MAQSGRGPNASASSVGRAIAYAKIFPSIGIARVGDSENEFFFGPEFLPSVSDKPSDHRYRDAEGRIKRQAARFRVYGFDARGRVVGEITAKQATIAWTVHLANKKAAWFEFQGAAKARQQFADSAEAEKHLTRNRQVRMENDQVVSEFGTIVRDPKTKRFVSDKKRKVLEIDGGAKSIQGASQQPEDGERGDYYRFKGYFKRGHDGYAGHKVYLGELRTDDEGRLVVLGGRGVSEPVGPKGPLTGDERLDYWIVHYANNDHWHDDVSDGPVTARVVLRSGKEVKVVGGSWVVAAPPDFAPDVTNLVTLYDVVEEIAIAARLKPQPGCPPLRDLKSVGFHHDIKPILLRANDYRWTSPLGLRGHGYRKPGEASSDNVLDPALRDDPAGRDSAKEQRERFFSVLRIPTYEALDPRTGKDAQKVNDKLAAEQATSFFMPPLSGDEGDRAPGSTANWFSLTRLQYARMEKWRNGDFVTDDGEPDRLSARKPDLQDEPARLTRYSLEACVGGAFYPGIEITSIARDPSLYSEPFRIDHSRVGPGDVTKYMACPWQADFYECRDAWWPAARPDAVVTDLTFEELFKDFEPEKSSGFEAVLFGRERWDRGLERKPRPSVAYLKGQLAPDPMTKDAAEYARLIGDRAADRLLALTPVLGIIDDGASIDPGVDAERLMSPWRLQFLTQEQLDGYSGRFFIPTVPSPEDAIKIPSNIRSVPDFSNLGNIRRNWNTLRITHTRMAAKILVDYASTMQSTVRDYVFDIILHMPPPKGEGKKKTPALQIQHNLKKAPPPNPQGEPQEFDEDSDAFRRLRGSEFVTQLVSRLFLRRSVQAPDMAMVDEWRNLGFVRRKTMSADEAREIPELTIQIETERDKYDGKSFRDHFYYLMNIAEFPDFLPFARVLAQRFLDAAQVLIDQTSIFDTNHPESFVPYTPENFAAKLEQIYEILRNDARRPQQYVYSFTRGEQVQALLAGAPFNQTDGAWLRYAANAGTMGEVTSLLFEVWSDEVGNGDPSLHHGNLFTTLLQSLGLYLPDITSRAYADDPRIEEANYIGAVFQLAISQHSQEFFPELLGMTLFLEWEVLSLVPRAQRREYFGIDSQFWRMHVGIDNATEGHGAKAKRAVELYLDQIFRESGPGAQQEHWKRIWRGFVAFATAGYDLFTSVDDQMSIETEEALHTRTPADRVAAIMRKKLHYGQLNHLRNRLGLYRINDLFDDPGIFLEELGNSPWIAPGDPDQSRFLNHLTTFQGPMYKVFAKEDLATWREWIEWLGKEGDTLRAKRHITRGEAMMMLLAELRQLMLASHGHRLYQVPTMVDESGQPILLIELFKSDDLKEVMRVLKNPKNGWVVPFRPAESALIVDLMRPGRGAMGAALDQRIPKLFNQVGRMVVYEWIAAGCPIPGEKMPDASNTVVPTRRPLRLFVQQYGMGAVH